MAAAAILDFQNFAFLMKFSNFCCAWVYVVQNSAVDNNLLTSDLNRLKDVSDGGSKMSWVDHILSSIPIDNIIPL